MDAEIVTDVDVNDAEVPAIPETDDDAQDFDEEQFRADADQLKQLILKELEIIERLADEDSKSAYKQIHEPYVCERLLQDQEWIRSKFPKYRSYFADGADIHIDDIRPKLIEVTESWQSDLFRLARYTWSLPYSSGYGRRIRFILIDESNEKLIGIIGLQSPPIDFNVRDKEFDFPKEQKVELINQMMDIFTLGAIPPYSILLGGKLVALSAAANEVVETYRRKYEGRVTHMEQQVLPSNLVALTTTSAFGRSSIYNRLKFHDRLVAQRIGFTSGYGSFHLHQVYPEIKKFLYKYDEVKSGYGDGPRSVWVNCRRAFSLVGITKNRLRHGVQREVFLFPLIANLKEYMSGQNVQPDFYDMPFDSIVEWWRTRWMFDRAERKQNWQTWDSKRIEEYLLLEEKR